MGAEIAGDSISTWDFAPGSGRDRLDAAQPDDLAWPHQETPVEFSSVAADFKDDWNTPFAEVATRVFEVLDDPAYTPPRPPPPVWAPPDTVDIDRLPVTGAELLGHDAELDWLDGAWEQGKLNVLSLVAYGGVGKSTLVRKWVESLERDHYRGARKVFAWSFYSQGTGERVTAAFAKRFGAGPEVEPEGVLG
jgi:hypothetical protein